MRNIVAAFVFGAVAALPLTAVAGETPPPAGAAVYFVMPQDGESVSNPVRVVFGLTGMGIASAGVEHAKTGHHHLLIDADLPPLDEPIPSDESYRHFGGGQTETFVTLPVGAHSLQLLMGDQNHIPHDPPMASQRIGITVR